MTRRYGIMVFMAACLAGCSPDDGGHLARRDAPVQTGSAEQTRLSQLESEIIVRDKQLAEIRNRADRLSRRIGELEFLNEQLKEQLAAVGDAPRQRDRYKQQAAASQLEIDRLRKQIEELRRVSAEPVRQPARDDEP